MKRNIFMYLFLFAALWVVFQYVNNVKIYEDQERKIQKLKSKDSTSLLEKQSLEERLFDSEYFTVKGNENAYSYFERDGFDVAVLIPKIEDELYGMNTKEGNPLIPFEGLRSAFRINKVQVINHKWLIADFSDGEYWGEILVKYEVSEGDKISFETMESLMYPRD